MDRIELKTCPVPTILRGAVVAIGNFDGVHVGHQALFQTARALANELRAPFAVLTFYPHPRAYFRPDTAPFLLAPPDVQCDRFAACGADGVFMLAFDDALASLSPRDFIDQILKTKLGVVHVVVGDDFHFGHNRMGTVKTIQDGGIPVTSVPLVMDTAGIPYSSTRIRAALQEGHVGDANMMLGWEWEMRGVVEHGDKRGRALGYPTLNIDLGATICPAHGIYAARVQVGDDEIWYGSAVSLGMRPMFMVSRPLLEAHVFGFSRDVYGQTARVRLVQKLRDEAKFGRLDDLVAQMKKDCDSARKLLELGS
jgi:riboflavin kinase/FMN adenylyltransferase